MYHLPVLLRETIDALQIKPGGFYVDGTFGGGGHSREILKQGGEVLAFDVDDDAIAQAEDLVPLKTFKIIKDNFINLKQYISKEVAGILFDLGESSHQFDDRTRGFSFQDPAQKLDMRMDLEAEFTAEKIINRYSQTELARIFRDYGEDRFAALAARMIVTARKNSPLVTVGQLLEVLKQVYPKKWLYNRRKHYATDVFRALRMEVNGELSNIEKVLPVALEVLASGGRLAIISFHSLEDRAVKHAFKEWAVGCICPPDFPECCCGHKPKVKLITRKPILPSPEEIAQNPRARSAKLRVVERLNRD